MAQKLQARPSGLGPYTLARQLRTELAAILITPSACANGDPLARGTAKLPQKGVSFTTGEGPGAEAGLEVSASDLGHRRPHRVLVSLETFGEILHGFAGFQNAPGVQQL